MVGAEISYRGNSKLDSLWNKVSEFYTGLESNKAYRKDAMTSGLGHTVHVLENIQRLYSQKGGAPSEELLAAAMCHDLGNYAELFNVKKASNNGDKHQYYSALILDEILEDEWASQLITIKKLVIAHNLEPILFKTEDEGILYTADKLTRLGTDGFDRLAFARDYGLADHDEKFEILVEISSLMDKAYEEIEQLGLMKEYAKALYDEGKEIVDQEKDKWFKEEEGPEEEEHSEAEEEPDEEDHDEGEEH
ncbi:HD domain-containing protein [Nanoarchaeota archaeon]